MPEKSERDEGGGYRSRFPAAVVPRPPVTAEDLKIDTESDPDGAEEFVALIQALRKERHEPVTL